MTEITQDTTVDVVDTCLNKITSPFARKLTERFIGQIGELLPTIARPAGKFLKPPRYFLVVREDRQAVIDAIETAKFLVPREDPARRGKYYKLQWLGVERVFLVHAVYQQ